MVNVSLTFFRRIFLTVSFLLLAACAASPEQKARMDFGDQSQVIAYHYRTSGSFVRFERLEPGAPANSHPASVPADAVRHMLAGVRVKGSYSIDTLPLLSSEELDEIAAPLAAALAKASPQQDVAFAVTGYRGLFGKYSSPSFTTARVFVREGRLNVIFGRMHELVTRESLGTGGRQDWTTGSRAQQLEHGLRIDAGGGQIVGDRADWLAFDIATVRATVPAAPAPKETATGATPAPSAPLVGDAERRAQKIAERMSVLDKLKSSGAITEDEYRERRRAILQEI